MCYSFSPAIFCTKTQHQIIIIENQNEMSTSLFVTKARENCESLLSTSECNFLDGCEVEHGEEIRQF